MLGIAFVLHKAFVNAERYPDRLCLTRFDEALCEGYVDPLEVKWAKINRLPMQCEK
jgi:hypothetical protein